MVVSGNQPTVSRLWKDKVTELVRIKESDATRRVCLVDRLQSCNTCSWYIISTNNRKTASLVRIHVLSVLGI